MLSMEPESLGVEYKEMRLSLVTINTLMSSVDKLLCGDSEAISFLRTGTFESINAMFSKYIHKYLACFGNCQDISEGKLFFGITDCGVKIGIPLLPDDISTIYASFHEQLDSFIHHNPQLPLDFKSRVQIQHTLVDHPDFIDPHEYYREKKEIRSAWKEKNRKDALIRNAFDEKMRYYKRSINEIINIREIRDELIAYIETHTSDHDYLIVRLRKYKTILFEEGEIANRKNNIDDLAYWIVHYRDDKINELFLDKPKRYALTSPPFKASFMILRDFYPLMKIYHESGYKFYVFEFTFPGKISHDLKYGTHVSVRGISASGEPCSIRK